MKKIILMLNICLVLAVFGKAQTITDIKKVDFANASVQIGKSTVKFKDGLQFGACKEKDSDGITLGSIWSLSNESIAYGDVYGDSRDEAIIPVTENICSGNMITDETVLVYTIKNGKLAKLPEFDYADFGCEPGKTCDWTRSPGISVEYDSEEKSVVVINSFATENDALCCPSLFRKTNYKWDELAFVETKKSKIIKREEGEK